jgi:DNA/RNA-binding domain of Phe-tRNA-synthetase-like protein
MVIKSKQLRDIDEAARQERLRRHREALDELNRQIEASREHNEEIIRRTTRGVTIPEQDETVDIYFFETGEL